MDTSSPTGPTLLDDADDLAAALPATEEFTKLSLWMAGAIAGVTTNAHAAQSARFHALADRLGWPPGRSPTRWARRASGKSARLLADALTGSSRDALVDVFGPPRCALTDREFQTGPEAWFARTWYYPLDHPAAMAVGVTFDESDCVTRVVFLRFGAK